VGTHIKLLSEQWVKAFQAFPVVPPIELCDELHICISHGRRLT